ncbi:MAG TPA: hypothetical protein VF033_08870 [Steroidobacteraceae bacterium]
MLSRAWILAALFVAPCLAQEPAFDLNGDLVRKIVRDAAASQSASVLVSEVPPAKAEPAVFNYVPPEPKPAPARTVARTKPAAPTQQDGFLSQLFDVLVDEWLGVDDVDDFDDITAANELLRCRVQKETKAGAPGVDNCPTMD